MGSSPPMLKLACALFACIVVAAPIAKAAITCTVVTQKLLPCLRYLTSNIPLPGACCAGVSGLSQAAATTADRRTACSCLKSLSGRISGINYAKAAALPGRCGVRIPYSISPSTDCSRIS
ncbi:hypothetical protein Droror1_Dr00026430 [Drosera rotundifolia]